MAKKKLIRIIACVLAVLMPVSTVIVAFATDGTEQVAASGSSKYDSLDVNLLTGDGEEPEEISVSAAATYQEKAWYEYVTYSDHPISSYRIDDDSRVIFYDPYTYTNSMVMDVKFDATTTEFDTMSEYSISHTTSSTIVACAESTYTNTHATQTSGRDLTGSTVTNTGTTKSDYDHELTNYTTGTKTDKTQYNYIEKDTFSWSLSESLKTGSATNVTAGVSASATASGNPLEISATAGTSSSVSETISIDGTAGSSQNWGSQFLTDTVTNTTEYSADYSTTTKDTGTDTITYDTKSETTGWTELSARVTKTLGSSSSTSNSWSETEGTTITKKYAATHFASDCVTPLPWAIVHYTVQMPMKCCWQIRHSGEWVTVSTVYCLLTTVRGTCRTWMENGQAYYEDWGSGEKVVATDFWSQFMTVDQLMNAYTNKLYPVGGEN